MSHETEYDRLAIGSRALGRDLEDARARRAGLAVEVQRLCDQEQAVRERRGYCVGQRLKAIAALRVSKAQLRRQIDPLVARIGQLDSAIAGARVAASGARENRQWDHAGRMSVEWDRLRAKREKAAAEIARLTELASTAARSVDALHRDDIRECDRALEDLHSQAHAARLRIGEFDEIIDGLERRLSGSSPRGHAHLRSRGLGHRAAV